MAKGSAEMSGFEAFREALLDLQRFFDEKSWKFCLVGGLAAIRWGEPRATRDIDIAVLVEFGSEPGVVDAMLAVFATRLAKAEARQFALDNRVLLLRSNSGIPVDVALAALPFEVEMFERAVVAPVIEGTKVPVATAEDVIVMKTVAGRPGDWQDIENIIARQRDTLDWGYIHLHLEPLLESLEVPERTVQLKLIRHKIEAEKAGPKLPVKKKKRSARKEK